MSKTSARQPARYAIAMFFRNKACHIPVEVLVPGPCLCPKNNTDIDNCIGFGTVFL
jgi:hypothetical protein